MATLQDLMLLTGNKDASGNNFSLVKYRPIGSGQAPGFSMVKLKTLLSDPDMVAIVNRYNKTVDEIVSRSEGFVAKEKAVTLNNHNSILGLEVMLGIAKDARNRTAGVQITDFLSTIEGKDPLRDSMGAFLQKYPDKGPELFRWILSSGVITKKPRRKGLNKSVENLELMFNKQRWANDKVRKMLMAKLDAWDINAKSVDQMFSETQKHIDELVTERFGRGNDSKLSVDEFFNRYFPESKPNAEGKGGMTADDKKQLIYDALYTSTSKDATFGELIKVLDPGKGEWAGSKAIDNMLSKMTFDANKATQARDHVIDLLSTHLQGSKIPVLNYTENGVKRREIDQSIFKNPFHNFLKDGLKIDYMLIDGTAMGWTTDRYGKPRRIVVDIFEKDASILSSGEKANRKSKYDAFKDLLDVWAPEGATPGQSRGVEIIQLAGHEKVIGVSKDYYPKITEAFNKLVEKYKPEFENNLKAKEKILRVQKELSKSSNWINEHTQALRALVYEQMLSGKDFNKFLEYIAEPAGSKKLANLEKRISLFNTSSFRPLDKSMAKAISESNGILKYYRNVAKYYSKNDLNFVTWNDKDFGDIRKRVESTLKEKGVTWDDMVGRESTSGFDSIAFISERFADFNSLMSGTLHDGTRVFKPKISSFGANEQLFAKTVFVHDPGMQAYFKNNSNIDIILTKTADKFAGDKPAESFINKDLSEFLSMKRGHNDPTLNTDNYSRKLSLESVSIGQVPKSNASGKVSQSLFQNYVNSGTESGYLFADYIAPRLDKSMDIMSEVIGRPMRENALLRRIYSIEGKEGVVNELSMKGEAANQRGLFLDWISSSYTTGAGPWGSSMLTNIMKAQYLEPSMAPQSYIESGGKRYDFGAKSVLAQSMVAHRNLQPTIVTKDGELKQYGEMVAPNRLRSMPIIFPGDKLKVKIVNSTSNKLIDAETWFKTVYKDLKGVSKAEVEAGWDFIARSGEPLGTLHDTIIREFPKGDFQIAMINSRFPRTRPGDLAILRLKDFLDPKWGNSTIVNDFDVFNIFEGDYDVDKMDMFWAMNNTTFKHIQDSHRFWVHKVDPSKLEPRRPNIELLSHAPKNEIDSWNSFHSNKRVMDKRGIGTVQSSVSMVNHIRNISEISQDGRYVVFKLKDGSTVEVDWNNKNWFERHALEAQSMIDHSEGVDMQLVGEIGGWRGRYLFPNASTLDKNISVGKERFLNNEGKYDSERLNQFVENKKNGTDKSRVRIFRRYAEKLNADGTRKELPLNDPGNEVVTDMIHVLMNHYNQLLQLAPGRRVYKRGEAQSHSYQDYIDRSNEYFNGANDITSYVFTHLKRMKDKTGAKKYLNPALLGNYFGNEKNELKRNKYSKSKWKKKEDLTNQDFYDWWHSSPFAGGTIENMKLRAGDPNKIEGGAQEISNGSLIERSMYKIWRKDPLSYHDKIVMDNKTFAEYDKIETILLQNESFKMDEIINIMPSLLSDVKQAKSQILRLNKMAYRVSRNYKMPKKRREEILESINEQKREYNEQIKPLLTNEYKKSGRYKDLGKIEIVGIENNQSVIDATVSLYVANNLRSLIHPKSNGGYKEFLKEARSMVGKEYHDLHNMTGFEYGERTLVDIEGRRTRTDKKLSAFEVEKAIEAKITEGVKKYGAAFLFDFMMPSTNSVAMKMGVFHGKPMPVSTKNNSNYKRVLRWLLKAQQNQLEGLESVGSQDAIGRILQRIDRTDYAWRNFFNGNLRDLPTGEAEWFGMMSNGVPEWHWRMKSLFRDYTDIRIGRDVTKDGFFGMGNRYSNNLKFFRKLFQHDKSTNFESDAKQLSYINQLMMENRYMNPYKYISLMEGVSEATKRASNEVFPSQIDIKTGKVQPLYAKEFFNDPVYLMAGGQSMTGHTGLTVDPAKIANRYETNMMYKIIQQSNSMTTTPRGNRFLDAFNKDKTMGRKGC